MLERKTVAILVEDGFEDSELSALLGSLKTTNARVVIVGNGAKKTFTGKRGKIRISANASASNVNFKDFDAVIIPGGYAPEKMRMNGDMVALVRNLCNEGKVVGALCHGPQLLISADVVKDKQVTSSPSIAVDLKNAGAEWVNQPVVVSGNLITSRKSTEITQFNGAIINALKWQP